MNLTNPNASDEIDLKLYWGVLRKEIRKIIFFSLLFMLSGFLLSNLLPPVYEASSILMVSENSALQTNEYNAVLTSERLARTYAEIMTAQPILEAVKTDLGLTEDLDSVKESIEVRLIPNTQLIRVTVQNTDPLLAVQITNTLVEYFINDNISLQQSRFAESKLTLAGQIAEQQGFVDQIQLALNSLPQGEEGQLERTRLEGLLGQYRQTYTQLLQSYEQLRLAEAQSTSNVLQVEPAILPDESISPKVPLNTLLAGVLGAALATSYVFLRTTLDNSIKNADEIRNNFDLSTLAFVAKAHEEDEIITASNPRSPISESFRSLRTNIQFASVDDQLKIIVVTSSVQGEGKSTIASNLAFVISQLGTETILIDADLRRPRLHKLFKVSNKKGLSNLFVNKHMDHAFDAQLQETKYPHLKIMSSGGIPPNPSELISTIRMNNILEHAKTRAELVIIDAPPVLPVTDAVVLAQKADGVIIVMVPGQTTMPMAKQAVESLRQVDAKILGVVFNNVDLDSAYFSSYRNAYVYHYDEAS
ncbi:MAG: polysaccharide biosynthesis tyrosine autokinase [Anaerolineales bacterium]|nr:polysaccharide biosynthesis tyrosine autokinase [Anaerolineales bacterium]MCW5855099.1 polysaccharide biosynthesis tyrosine autokinase [Anaerolineales bacterium]